MGPNPMRCTPVGGAVVALAIITSPFALAADANATPNAAPIVVAQVSAPASTALATSAGDTPVHLRGVRQAATQGPEALRRYIWRTRMIYNHWYNTFAPKE